MFLKKRIIDDYYDSCHCYPPNKDIQLIIFRYACRIDIETCRNIRLVRKCIAYDKDIMNVLGYWVKYYDAPLKMFDKLQASIKQKGYIDWMLIKIHSLRSDFRTAHRYDRSPLRGMYLDFSPRTTAYKLSSNYINIEISKLYGEIALTLKSSFFIKDKTPDVLFFIYFDPDKNKNIGYNEFLDKWILNDEVINDYFVQDGSDEFLCYHCKYSHLNNSSSDSSSSDSDLSLSDSDESREPPPFEKGGFDNIHFNDFELKCISNHYNNDQKKHILGVENHKGVCVYFANLNHNCVLDFFSKEMVVIQLEYGGYKKLPVLADVRVQRALSYYYDKINRD